MHEIGPEHRVEYREEILGPFFRYIRSADSFYVVGAASMGKTRLLDHLTKPAVQGHYLKENAGRHWLIRVDMNRMINNEPIWPFYELLVSSIILSMRNREDYEKLELELTKSDVEIIQKRDPLLALRLFEYIVNKLCDVYELSPTFLFDEFDTTYKSLPKEIFLQLRAVRDANKNRVSFVLFLRSLPELLRSPTDNESFYELLSRNPIGIGPYQEIDGLQIIKQLETRKQHPITDEEREKIFHASGGHPGLMQALLSVLMDRPQAFQKVYGSDWAKELIQESVVVEECRKIWEGLLEGEQQRLPAFYTGEYKKGSLPIDKLLFAKGLVHERGNTVEFFTDLFKEYVKAY